MSCEAVKLTVIGVVQGVGFRPFVYREALSHHITGWVLNTTEGVIVHAEGQTSDIDAFAIALSERAPLAAQVREINIEEVPVEGFQDFEIRFSQDKEVEETTLVSPDLATCDDCVAELFDPKNRRYHYPFINCTNCGPRFQRSCAPCPMIARRPQCAPLRCAPIVKANTTILLIGVFTLSPMPVLNAVPKLAG